MTKYTFPVVIPANGAAAINLATAAIAAGAIMQGAIPSKVFSATYLPFSRLSLQMAAGGTGAGFLGSSNLTFAGVNAEREMNAATVSVPGGSVEFDSSQDRNAFNLSTYYVHGATPGDVVLVTYYQA